MQGFTLEAITASDKNIYHIELLVSFTENFTYTKNNTTINAKFLYFSCVALKWESNPMISIFH